MLANNIGLISNNLGEVPINELAYLKYFCREIFERLSPHIKFYNLKFKIFIHIYIIVEINYILQQIKLGILIPNKYIKLICSKNHPQALLLLQ